MIREEVRRNAAGIPVRVLGKTGLEVSLLGFGGGHYCRPHLTESQSIDLVRMAVEQGVTFMDNAWEYWDGESERRMGLGLQGIREQVVLMTKVCARDKATALKQLHDSLTRLKTDVIDVWQFHEVNYDNDPDWIFGDESVLAAADAARRAGKVRFVGFTGHKSPHILRKMFEYGFEWDTCQMPINVLDHHFRSFQNEVLPLAIERNMGVIGMKSLGGDAQLVTGAGLTPQECRQYAMSLPISTLVAGIESPENLEQDLAIARAFAPLSEDELQTLRDRVRGEATDGRFEWFKTMQKYDSKYHRVQHGFPEETQ